MRHHSAALSRLAVMPAAALAVLVTPQLTGSHHTQSAQSAPSLEPVAAVSALSSDVPASHARTAHQEALRQRFYAGLEKARHDAAQKRFYAAVQAQHDAVLKRFYAGVQQAATQKAAPVAAASQAATAAPSGPASNMNWSALAACESSGNPQAVSSGGYMGLYQFDQRTWESVGGSGSPLNASSAEQTLRAEILFSQRGSSPWPVCGSRLYT